MSENDNLTIRNNHVPSCGTFPEWARTITGAAYFAYFENEHGEQWLLLATLDEVKLAGGDIGWEQVHVLKNPDWTANPADWTTPGDITFADAVVSAARKWPGITMSFEEGAWLRVALTTAKHRFERRYKDRKEASAS